MNDVRRRAPPFMPQRLLRDRRFLRLDRERSGILLRLYLCCSSYGVGPADEIALRATLGIVDGDALRPTLDVLATTGLVILYDADGDTWWELERYDDDAPADLLRKRGASEFPLRVDRLQDGAPQGRPNAAPRADQGQTKGRPRSSQRQTKGAPRADQGRPNAALMAPQGQTRDALEADQGQTKGALEADQGRPKGASGAPLVRETPSSLPSPPLPPSSPPTPPLSPTLAPSSLPSPPGSELALAPRADTGARASEPVPAGPSLWPSARAEAMGEAWLAYLEAFDRERGVVGPQSANAAKAAMSLAAEFGGLAFCMAVERHLEAPDWWAQPITALRKRCGWAAERIAQDPGVSALRDIERTVDKRLRQHERATSAPSPTPDDAPSTWAGAGDGQRWNRAKLVAANEPMWSRFLAAMRERVEAFDYKQWIASLGLEFGDADEATDRVIVVSPDTSHSMWVEEHYGDTLREVFAAVCDRAVRVEFYPIAMSGAA